MPATWLTVAEAAARRGVSRQSIYVACRSGRLPYKVVFGKWVLPAAAVDAYQPLKNTERKGVKFGPRMPGGARSTPTSKRTA